MVKTRTWAAVIGCILLLAGAAAVWLWLRPAPGHVAEIYSDGALRYTVDLDRVREPQRLTVEGPRGVNVILIEPGRIRVESADCPDQVCVNAGWLSDSASPIVCLPHRLVIRLTGGAGPDTTAG